MLVDMNKFSYRVKHNLHISNNLSHPYVKKIWANHQSTKNIIIVVILLLRLRRIQTKLGNNISNVKNKTNLFLLERRSMAGSCSG